MKVVQLQYSLSPSGDFARRFHNEFMKVGIDSSVLSLHSDITLDERTKSLGRRERLTAKLNNRAQNVLTRNIKKNYGLFSYPVVGTNVAKLEQVKEADVIFLHWVLHGFLSLKNMEQIAQLGKPVIFILHDMWAITGGCHYSYECEKYKTNCQSCEMFISPKKNDLAAAAFKKKLDFYAKYDNLYFVSPSKWLADCAKASSLTRHKPVYHIPNVLDRNLFKPFSKDLAKHILNIRQDRKIIAFGAVSIDSPFKGWKYLEASMKMLHEEAEENEYAVLIFGGADNASIVKSIPFETILMGRVRDEYTMALIYNAADIFIAPSLADNLPYTIFESLACGTPVVAFNTGGIPDLVQHRNNGYLAAYKDAKDVTRGVKYCLKNQIQGSLSPKLDTCLNMQKYLEFIQFVMKQKQNSSDKVNIENFTQV